MQDDVPQLYQDHLNDEQLEALFADLERGAEVEHVQVKMSSGDRIASLHEARELLGRREARAVQIRYQYQGETWCDTLLVAQEGIRIVRSKWMLDE